ncbi:Ku DNA-binding complex Ku70 subunit [Punctularia strigosozonata HHB-11173 SS5]|uniref:Ku DNA-binding complex Ku70 subunit n=1 Tax=Punctularia strigosozonata (strain HHB-11173) TaxID=741275 RepID=UPI00044170B6|nr:Ku DNA-binding complex Ku70 subunit [Punctularia strigosozonata HHB-11173 SS5]EIN06584.1 Ku DNA-binding complex Ku70 subunit [Punctularia strigosozonata HHB-11173 SS5]
MAPYDDWNKLDEEEEQELEDTSFYDARRDVILFAIDCSSSMLELRDDPTYEEGEVKTCHLLVALQSAMEISKKKVLVGPNDSIGILFFNTTRRNQKGDNMGQSSEIKPGAYVYQPISTVNASSIQELIRLLNEARENPSYLSETFPPLPDGEKMAMGDVFTSCNWVIRDGAPKTATKRIFLITDEDDPTPSGYDTSAAKEKLITSAQTTLTDLTQAGIMVEPFFISTEERSFDIGKFYTSVLNSHMLPTEEEDGGALPEQISITRIDDLLGQMRFHEVPKRSLFSIGLELAPGFRISVKGYGLVTEQKKGKSMYFVDMGDRMEVAESRAAYVDEDYQEERDKSEILFGMELGSAAASAGQEDQGASGGGVIRPVERGKRVFYTADEVRGFRTMGLEPGLKLLGFKDRSELAFEDNVKHSVFIYPDEMTYSGSKRTFSSLLKSMLKKDKIAIVLALLRRNASPTFCAMLPQAEKQDEAGWNDPAGFHLIPLPFADDIRAAALEEGFRASEDVKKAAQSWVEKLCLKNGTYEPDSYPNPSLAFHNAQLQASAFREEYDPTTFEDLTLPKIDMIHKRAGKLIQMWKEALAEDPSSGAVIATATGATKRKADAGVNDAEVRSMYENGWLTKLRVDQLKDFLKSKSLPVSGRKGELVDRAAEWLESHE